MKDFLPVLNTTGIASILGFFLWWKSTLQKELVDPAIQSLKVKIEYLEKLTAKQESLQLRLQETLENKMDKLQETTSMLNEKVAELSGELRAKGAIK